jgi:sigma-B regulation protein RsbU (phosphoserine phosphatase)
MATQPMPEGILSADQEQIRSLLLLNDTVQKLNSVLDFNALLDRISTEVRQFLGCVETAIWIRDVESNEMVLVGVCGCTTEKCGNRLRIGEQGMVGHVAATGRTRYAPDVAIDQFYIRCEPDARSELTVPLIHNGEVLGVFTASSRTLDGFCPEKRELLERLASHMATAINNARHFTRHRSEREEARRIQSSLFPKTTPFTEQFRIQGLCVPAGEVGGDWYDYFRLPDGRIAVVLADVSGKGMPAALLMSSTRGILRASASFISKPSEVLVRLNQMLVEDLPPETFITMIFGILDPPARTFTYSNAGHPWPIYTNGHTRFLTEASGLPLGVKEYQFTDHVVELTPGTRLLFYSDGIAEASNRAHEEYGATRLMEFAARPEVSVDSLLADASAFSGSNTFTDDATIVLIQSV